MSKNIQESLDSCLFFTVKKLDRALNKLAEESFQKVGMTPTYAFILLILAEEDGRLQKDIAQILYIAPSTLTRLVEKLVYKGYVTTLTEGRTRKFILQSMAENFYQISEKLGTICMPVIKLFLVMITLMTWLLSSISIQKN